MGRLIQILPAQAVSHVAGVACISSLALALMMLCSCAKSPYRRVMHEMNRPTSARLNNRIREVSEQYQAAMDQFDATAALLTEIAAGNSSPREWDMYRCRDAVERCDWWVFNLERETLSIADLAPPGTTSALHLASGAGTTNGDAVYGVAAGECRELIGEFDSARQLMQSVARGYAEAVEVLAESASTGTDVPVVSLLEPTALREAVATVRQLARAVTERPPQAVNSAEH